MSCKIACVFLAAFLAVVVAEVAEIDVCENVDTNACTVSEVRIVPCKQKKFCRFKKGNDAAMSFDFTPNFSATSLKTGVYWANGAMELPFADLDSNACTYTSCPAEAGKSQQLNYSLHIGKKLPSGRFLIKWKVWNEADESQVCCFKTTIELRK